MNLGPFCPKDVPLVPSMERPRSCGPWLTFPRAAGCLLLLGLLFGKVQIHCTPEPRVEDRPIDASRCKIVQLAVLAALQAGR